MCSAWNPCVGSLWAFLSWLTTVVQFDRWILRIGLAFLQASLGRADIVRLLKSRPASNVVPLREFPNSSFLCIVICLSVLPRCASTWWSMGSRLFLIVVFVVGFSTHVSVLQEDRHAISISRTVSLMSGSKLTASFQTALEDVRFWSTFRILEFHYFTAIVCEIEENHYFRPFNAVPEEPEHKTWVFNSKMGDRGPQDRK